MVVAPERFPYPDTDAFHALPAPEQAWVRLVFPWFARGTTAGSPTRVMDHPTMDLFRSDLRHHLPLLVKYYLTAPTLFQFALRTLTDHSVDASTYAEAKSAWQAYLKDRFAIAA